MGGKPAARLGDGTAKGGPIVQGSSTVLIGSGGGVACSVCPGGLAVGNPVNPQLGAKVLSGETDFSLPGLLPFTLSRSYSSYQTDTPAPVSLFGPGWNAGFDISLLIKEKCLILNDTTGRSITFDPLMEGEITYSRSEGLWLMRCGEEPFDPNHRLYPLWDALPDSMKNNPHLYLACNDPRGPWWILGYIRPHITEEAVLPQPLAPRRILTGICDRFGRRLTYRRRLGGELHGQIVEVEEENGRCYRLELTVLSEEQRAFSRKSRAYGWGADSGIRLTAVYLTRDADSFSSTTPATALPSHPLVRYEYGQRGELIKVYDRSGEEVREFGYHQELWGRMIAHRMVGQSKAALYSSTGPISSYQYNKQGKVIAQFNEGGLNYQFEYQSNQTIVTDSLGRVTRYHFKGKKGLARLVKLELPDGSTQHNEFDTSGRLVAQQDALGRRTEYGIDVTNGNLIAIYHPDGLKTEFNYTYQGQLTDTIYPNRSHSRLEYDDLGRLTKEQDVYGNCTEFRYAKIGQKSATGATLPLDFPLERQDANSGVQKMAWDNLGQLTTYTDCSGYQTHYCYNRWGQVTEVQQEGGLVNRNRYNHKGELTESENSLGEITQYYYTPFSQLESITYPDGSRMRMEYNPQALLIQRQFAGLSQQFAYDSAGRLSQITNENGATYQFQYDVMDRLSEEIAFDGRTRHYSYNAMGLLTESSDNGLTTRYLYDHGDRLVKRLFTTAEPDNSTSRTNQQGQQNQRPYNRDAIWGKDVPLPPEQPQEESWHYDKFGQLMAVSHFCQGHEVIVEYRRDKGGRIIAESQTVKDSKGNTLWSHSAQQQFDKLGLIKEQQLKGLDPIAWQTYGSGHLLGVKIGDESLIEFERDRLHRESSRQFGDTTLQRHYDKLGRLASMELTAQQSWNSHYHYDKRGQLTTIISSKGEYRYQYDKAGRIEEAHTPYYQQAYRFDPAGNRTATLTDDLMRQMQSFWSDNRIKEDELYRYRYDLFGNLIERQHKQVYDDFCQYHYDHQQRLIRFTNGYGMGEIRGRYIYDPFGRRVTKVTSQADGGKAQTYWYGWLGDNLVLTEQADTLIHTIYEPGSFVPLLRIQRQRQPEIPSLADKLQIQAEGEYHPTVIELIDQIEEEIRQDALSPEHHKWLTDVGFHIPDLFNLVEPIPEIEQQIHLYQCDHLGTPIALINQQGEADWQAELDIWGNIITQENPKQLYQPIRLQGQHYDVESGLHYNRHRYYDPVRGRYITQDPIGLLGGLHVYDYVNGNPTSQTDPLGLVAPLVIAGVCAAGGCEALIAAGAATLAFATYLTTPQGQQAVSGAVNAVSGAISNTWDGVLLMAKGGTQSKENEYSRAARQYPDPCEWLKKQYDTVTCSADRQKIKTAQKALGCRHSSRKK